jgi:hypothetical protein
MKNFTTSLCAPPAAEEGGHDVARVDPVLDVRGQHVEQRVEHEPEAREDEQVDPHVGLHQLLDGLGHEASAHDAAGLVGGRQGEAIGLAGLLVEQQHEEVERDDGGAGEEDVAPLHLAHVAGDQRAQEPADVDGLIEDAPSHRAVLALGGLDQRALDARLEHGGAAGEQQGAGEEAV